MLKVGDSAYTFLVLETTGARGAVVQNCDGAIGAAA